MSPGAGPQCNGSECCLGTAYRVSGVARRVHEAAAVLLLEPSFLQEVFLHWVRCAATLPVRRVPGRNQQSHQRLQRNADAAAARYGPGHRAAPARAGPPSRGFDPGCPGPRPRMLPRASGERRRQSLAFSEKAMREFSPRPAAGWPASSRRRSANEMGLCAALRRCTQPSAGRVCRPPARLASAARVSPADGRVARCGHHGRIPAPSLRRGGRRHGVSSMPQGPARQHRVVGARTAAQSRRTAPSSSKALSSESAPCLALSTRILMSASVMGARPPSMTRGCEYTGA